MGTSAPKSHFVFVAEDDPIVRELVLTRLAMAGTIPAGRRTDWPPSASARGAVLTP